MVKSSTISSFMCTVILCGCGGDGDGESVTEVMGVYYSWMSTEIQEAWSSGLFGQGTRVTIVDAFRQSSADQPLLGNLGDGADTKLHGEWVSDQIAMLSPLASQNLQDFSDKQAVALETGKLNIINLSYGMIGDSDPSGNPFNNVAWSAREQSIIRYAEQNQALIVKSAGNDGVAVDEMNQAGDFDYLNLDLIGTRSALFVGALNVHGSVENGAVLEPYSNFAGTNPVVQEQFLVVGVTRGITGLAGTSFAAPIVSGYAAVLGSKFTSDSPEHIKNRLVQTARTDTIRQYDPFFHGKGEASLSRALAPDAIQ